MTLTIREPGSALSHFIGMLLATFASVPILIKAVLNDGTTGAVSISIFMTSMILLYAASTIYHSVTLPAKYLKFFRKIDHMMIFILIAGTYTPVCMLVLEPSVGRPLLTFIWRIAILGILIKFLWITCPKWFSSVIYITMGWACVSVFGDLLTALSTHAFLWLLAGGILYTVGGVIYALKLPLFNSIHKYFGSHELFHLFVMGGSICHFICIYTFVL